MTTPGYLILVGASLLGCDGCARGPGKAGTAPIEQSSPAPSTPMRPGLADACRGVALPADQHFVAHGLCARAVADNQGELRQITFAPNGDLFGVTIAGAILRYRDANADGFFQANEIEEWASTGGGNGNNCHIDGAFLYAGTKEGVRRWPYAATIDHGGMGEDVMIGQPGGGNHPFHPVHVYDGWMYVDSGSEKNVPSPITDDYDLERSVLKRFDLSKLVPGKPFAWKDGEVFVKGVRNVTGFTRSASGRMVGVLSGIDDLRHDGVDVHPDNPGEEIVLLEKDRAYGYPLCFLASRIGDGKVVTPGSRLHTEAASQNPLASLTKSPKDDAWCKANVPPPLTFMQAHSSPLGIAFFDGALPGGALPARLRSGAFVALHGSWDRTPSTGYKVIWVPFDALGNAPMPTATEQGVQFPYEVIFGGGSEAAPRDGSWGWHVGDHGEAQVRPVGVAISPVDGALYVSSDNGGIPLRPKTDANGGLYRIGLRR